MSIFPLFESSNSPMPQNTLPLMKEIARDPQTGATIWKYGKPVVVSGAEAVLSWALAALRSRRGTGKANTRWYGSEFHKLIGSAFDEDVKTAILPRLQKDVLLQCPYITEVETLSTSFSDGRLSSAIRLKTIYGEVKVDVYDD